jgi:hypothetical protein
MAWRRFCCSLVWMLSKAVARGVLCHGRGVFVSWLSGIGRFAHLPTVGALSSQNVYSPVITDDTDQSGFLYRTPAATEHNESGGNSYASWKVGSSLGNHRK